VPLNFTYNSNVVEDNFGPDLVPGIGTGDFFRKGVGDMEYALASGIKVAMVYGDRDERCNWLGGESTAHNAEWSHKHQFQESGYVPIVTNSAFHGGVVSKLLRRIYSTSPYEARLRETWLSLFFQSREKRISDVPTGQTIRPLIVLPNLQRWPFGIRLRARDSLSYLHAGHVQRGCGYG